MQKAVGRKQKAESRKQQAVRYTVADLFSMCSNVPIVVKGGTT